VIEAAQPESPFTSNGDPWFRLACLAAVVTLCFLLLSVLSYGLAQYSPLEIAQPEELALLRQIAQAAPAMWRESLERFMTDGSAFADRSIRAAAVLAPMAIATMAMLMGLIKIARAPAVTTATVKTVFYGSMLIGLACLPAYPIFTGDFWLSIGWGRTLVEGHNPYYYGHSVTAIQGLPIDQPGMLMTYGPLWALLSGAMAFVGQRYLLLEFLMNKLLLLLAWCAMLLFIRRSVDNRPLREQAFVILLVGWIPGPLWLTLAEGHNDIVMIAPLTLWLCVILKGWRPIGLLSLFTAALVKYVMAPLILLDAVHHRAAGKQSVKAYSKPLALGVVSSLAILALFVRDTSFLQPASAMRNWVFWTPATAVSELSWNLGIPVNPSVTTPAFTILFVAILIKQLVSYFRNPVGYQAVSAALAFIILITFVSVGHVWPWFLSWGVPLAAVTWRHWLSRAFLAVVICSPIMNVAWFIDTSWRWRESIGMAMYGGALVLLTVSSLYRGWHPKEG